MSDRGILRLILCLVAVAVVGCETLHNAGVPGFEMYAKVDKESQELERSNREKFQGNRDHKALYWLISHRISNGMKLGEVEDILGEPGEFTTDYKSSGSEGLHQVTDMAYKWGPDSTGKSVVLWFRDGNVSNFDPKDYRKP